MINCYHGTNKKNADKILETGFRIGTYFAYKLKDALHFGGDHVFKVGFHENKFHGDESWQFFIKEIIPANKIIEYRHIV